MVYHWTHKKNLNDILQNGLIQIKHDQWHSGDGIYVWDNAIASISFVTSDLQKEMDEAILVEIDMNMDDPSLLMDEDSASDGPFAFNLNNEFIEEYPEASAWYYRQYNHKSMPTWQERQVMEEEPPLSNTESNVVKDEMIRKFMIRPNPDFADWGQGGRGWSARTLSPIPLKKIRAIYVRNEREFEGDAFAHASQRSHAAFFMIWPKMNPKVAALIEGPEIIAALMD